MLMAIGLAKSTSSGGIISIDDLGSNTLRTPQLLLRVSLLTTIVIQNQRSENTTLSVSRESQHRANTQGFMLLAPQVTNSDSDRVGYRIYSLEVLLLTPSSFAELTLTSGLPWSS